MATNEKDNSWEETDFPTLAVSKPKDDEKRSLNDEFKNESEIEKNNEEEWDKHETLFVTNTGEERFENVEKSCDPICTDAATQELKDYYNSKTMEEFHDIGISSNLLRGIVSMGFEKPSPIQKKAILPFIEDHDLIAQAQSGTGKTATFLISVLHKIDPEINNVQAFIISHTQELALQTFKILKEFSQYMEVRSALCCGSENKDDNIEELTREQRPHILVCTPGRLNHMISECYFSTKNVRMMVLDEADQLFTSIFYNQIFTIYKSCMNSELIQIGMYSATISPETQDLMYRVVRKDNFVHFKVEQEKLTLDGITQWYSSFTRPNEKHNKLIEIFESGVMGQVIVYCNKKEQTVQVARSLCNEGFKAVAVNSDLKSHERKEVMKSFRSGEIRFLVCTNMLARGIDVQQVSLVINYDFPNNDTCENYLHRVGRSGRFGRKGYAISFITSQDVPHVRQVEEFYHMEMVPLPETYATILSK